MKNLNSDHSLAIKIVLQTTSFTYSLIVSFVVWKEQSEEGIEVEVASWILYGPLLALYVSNLRVNFWLTTM